MQITSKSIQSQTGYTYKNYWKMYIICTLYLSLKGSCVGFQFSLKAKTNYKDIIKYGPTFLLQLQLDHFFIFLFHLSKAEYIPRISDCG